MKKIGELGHGGAGQSDGHKRSDDSTLKELFCAVREELDALYAKLDADAGVSDTDFAASLPKFEK